MLKASFIAIPNQAADRRWMRINALLDLRSSRDPRLSSALLTDCILFQHRELLEEVVLVDAHRALEEAGQVLQHADFAAALGQQRQPGQVEHQRGGQERIAALPDELQDHLRAEEALEVDVVPGRLPVVQRFDVLDGHVRLRLVADDLRR